MDDRSTGNLIHAEEAFAIQGAVYDVYRAMGGGFLESVYQECLALEFAARRIPFRATPKLTLTYKGVTLQQTYAPDFVCFDRIIVELKAVREVAPEHRAQVLNYLRATGFELGLLVNFRPSAKATVERLVLQKSTANPRENTRTDPEA
jgi:GxxExxY protein